MIRVMVTTVMCVIKMGNIVSRGAASLAFRASVLTIIPWSLPRCHPYTQTEPFMQLLAREISADYYIRYIYVPI